MTVCRIQSKNIQKLAMKTMKVKKEKGTKQCCKKKIKKLSTSISA